MLHNDLEVICFDAQLGTDIPGINVYALGDWHLGSAQTDVDKLRSVISNIQSDPQGYIIICGDMLDVATKSSVSDCYESTMTIGEQRRVLHEILEPVADRIICVVPGNHEDRIRKETGMMNPLYDVCVLLGIDDRYRENIGLIRIAFGKRNSSRSSVYGGVVSHGSSIQKHRKFINTIENIDFSIAGHTHNNHEVAHGRIRLNLHEGTAKQVPFEELVVSPGMDGVGGYGTKKEFPVPAPYKLQYFELKKIKNGISKAINYHSVQI